MTYHRAVHSNPGLEPSVHTCKCIGWDIGIISLREYLILTPPPKLLYDLYFILIVTFTHNMMISLLLTSVNWKTHIWQQEDFCVLCIANYL